MDEALVLELARSSELLVTLEENAVAGGAGSGVNELLLANGIATPTLNLGLPDEFIEHGTHDDQLQWTSLDGDSITRQIQAKFESMGRGYLPEAENSKSIKISLS